MAKQDKQLVTGVFVNRRYHSRRLNPDPCRQLAIDLYHRKRRKQPDRRNPSRTLQEDFYAYASQSVKLTT